MTNESKQPDEPQPMTPEEREARYEELRRRSQISQIFAECRNPNIAVRWVRKDDPNDIALHEWMGFRIAKDNPRVAKEKRRFNTAIPPKEDGTYVLGDVILMEIPKDDYDFFVNEGIQRSRELVDGGKKAFVSEANKLGVPTFQRDQVGNITR